MTAVPLGTLPAILADESLYSWCATVHHMTCSVSSAATGAALLGSPHAMRQHDLPAGLRRLPLLERQDPHQVMAILRKHTIAGYYLPFLSLEKQLLVQTQLFGHQNSHWRKMVSGLSRTRPLSHPVKWCAQCVDDDKNSLGRSYWQYPSTCLCPKHETLLLVLPGCSKRWLLPHSLSQAPPDWALPSDTFTTAAILSAVGAVLPELDCIDMESMRAAAIDRMIGMGVIHSPTRASHDRILRWFKGTDISRLCQAMPVLEQFAEGDWVPELLWRKRLDTAIRWVLFWAALDWESPKMAARAFVYASMPGSRCVGSQLLLFDIGSSMQSAPAHVWRAFEACDSYAEVMSCLRVSRGDVVRWLEQDPMLRIRWRERLKEGRQREYANRIRAVAAESDSLTRQDVEDRFPTEVAWLRKHARSLLHALLQSIPARTSAQRHLFE